MHQVDRRDKVRDSGDLSPQSSHLSPSRNTEFVKTATRDPQQLGRAVHAPLKRSKGVGRLQCRTPVIHKGVRGVLGVDEQCGSPQHPLSVLLKPSLPSSGTVVVARCSNNLHRSTTFVHGHLGEISRQLDRRGNTRRIIARALKEGVAVSHDNTPFRVLRLRGHHT